MALEAIRDERTAAELAKTYDTPTMMSGWKRTAIETVAQDFSGRATAEPTISVADIEKLHAKIGQLVVERDFCRTPPASSSALEIKSGETRPS